MTRGACSVGPNPERAAAQRALDRHFPSGRGGNDGSADAKAICATCSVADECLEYALRNRIERGVWGGKSMHEREEILKLRAAEAA